MKPNPLLEKLRKKQTDKPAGAPCAPLHKAETADVFDQLKTPNTKGKRACCESEKGPGEHLPTCQHMQPPKSKQKKVPLTPRGRDAHVEQKGRLPHGSSFSLAWDANAERWFGILTIADVGPFKAVGPFSGKARGVFRLLTELDDAYRQSLPVDANPEALP